MRRFLLAAILLFTSIARAEEHRYLYVAVPGIRDYLEYGGHGVLVFDIDHEYRLLKRIPAGGLDAKGKPLNVRGICASAKNHRLFVSTIASLECFDLVTDKLLWEHKYDGGVDRMAITPDGKTIYAPSDEKTHWNIIDATSGDLIKQLPTENHSHNTVISAGGKRAFLADLGSKIVQVADTSSHQVAGRVGPFTNFVRPFTTDGRGSRIFACVNGLLGFEVGDVAEGRMIQRVEVSGFKAGPTKRHGCPSHGIGLTPDEREIWLCDSANKSLHVFDVTEMPPKEVASIAVGDEPGWVTFSIDGRIAWPSSGEAIDVPARKIVTTLKDEDGHPVQSEKLLEIDFDGLSPVLNGDQFGIGQIH